MQAQSWICDEATFSNFIPNTCHHDIFMWANQFPPSSFFPSQNIFQDLLCKTGAFVTKVIIVRSVQDNVSPQSRVRFAGQESLKETVICWLPQMMVCRIALA
ncbi:hypothetical protein BsWGS_18550 [Bradybaena similaris]